MIHNLCVTAAQLKVSGNKTVCGEWFTWHACRCWALMLFVFS